MINRTSEHVTINERLRMERFTVIKTLCVIKFILFVLTVFKEIIIQYFIFIQPLWCSMRIGWTNITRLSDVSEFYNPLV